MPSVSKAQAKTMRAAAKNPEFAKEVGIPSDVADEFYSADRASGKADIAKLPARKSAAVPTRPTAGAPKTSSVPLFGGKK
jgi:hypothetical protein